MLRRRWRIPPLPAHGLEARDAAGILTENVAGVGVLLWDSVRDVLRWAEAPSSETGEVFVPGTAGMRFAALLAAPALPAALDEPLQALARLVEEPQRARRERVALACRRIFSYAEAEGALATAGAFALAAASVCPGDAALAYQAGRMARRRAENGRSETWLKRAIVLGRQSGDWESYTRGYIGLGNLYMQRGRYPVAQQAHLKGLARARRYRLRELEANAFHDLLALANETIFVGEMGYTSRAEEFAAEALRAYGPGHAKLPALAHDVAYHWMMRGEFVQSLAVFRAALPHFNRSSERLLVISNLARAAGAASERDVYDEAWTEGKALVEVVRQSLDQESLSYSLLNFAQAAISLRLWEMASSTAYQAREVALQRGESKVVFSAEALLGRIQRADAVPAVQPANSIPDVAGCLVNELVEGLSLCAAG